MIHFMRCKFVCVAKGCGKSTLYEEVHQGLFTPPVKTGKRASAWPNHEVEILNRARVAGKTDAEVKEIVADLIAARRVLHDPRLMTILRELGLSGSDKEERSGSDAERASERLVDPQDVATSNPKADEQRRRQHD